MSFPLRDYKPKNKCGEDNTKKLQVVDLINARLIHTVDFSSNTDESTNIFRGGGTF